MGTGEEEEHTGSKRFVLRHGDVGMDDLYKELRRKREQDFPSFILYLGPSAPVILPSTNQRSGNSSRAQPGKSGERIPFLSSCSWTARG